MTAQSQALADVEVVGAWLCGWRFALPRRSLRAVAAARRVVVVASEVASGTRRRTCRDCGTSYECSTPPYFVDPVTICCDSPRFVDSWVGERES
jgi:hypothetical protein